MPRSTGSRTAYVEMVRLQKLNKAKAEMEIAHLSAQSAAIDEENDALFTMHNDRFEGGAVFVPADIIMKRLETNKARQTQIAERADVLKRELLRTSRTLDTLNNRLHALEKELERVGAEIELEEYMGNLFAKHSV